MSAHSLKLLRQVWLVLGTALLLAACSEQPAYDALPRGTTVLAFGDSVTYGTGARQGEDYPSLLAHLSGWEIVNAGIPGDTAQEAKQRIEQALQETLPTLVIIELGGNDFLRRRSEGEVKEDLREIVRAVKTAGAQPVLVAVPRVSLLGAAAGALSDSAIYRELAEEEQVPLIEKVFSKVLSDDALRADRVHPNAEGYRVLTEGFAQALAEIGLLARP